MTVKSVKRTRVVAGQRVTENEADLLVAEYERARRRAKKAYDESDRLEQSIIARLGPAGSLVLGDGRTLRVVDNFIDQHGNTKHKAYGVAGVKRYEIEVK